MANLSRHLDDLTAGQPKNVKGGFRKKLIKLSDDLAHQVYPLTYKFRPEEKYSLGDQIRRSMVSVPANLIEGIARGGKKEKRQFANIAYGSLKEAKYLVYFAFREGLINSNDYLRIKPKFEELSRLLFTFLKILKNDV